MANLNAIDTRYRIVHLHIFKNAGTSIDRYFFDLLGPERCVEFEDPDHQRYAFPEAELHQQIVNHPDALYFTSHKALLPHDMKGIVPIVILRHPYIRVLSCYHFEKHVQAVLPEGETLQTYVEKRLRQHRLNAIIGKQVATLAGAKMNGEWTKSALNQAVLTYAKSRVAECDTIGTIDHLETIVQTALNKACLTPTDAMLRAFPRENAHLGLSQVEKATETLKAELSGETYRDLLQQTAIEVELFDFASDPT